MSTIPPQDPFQPADPAAELEARFGPSGWAITANPGGVAVWIAVRKNGTATRIIAACGPGELYAKLQAVEEARGDGAGLSAELFSL